MIEPDAAACGSAPWVAPKAGATEGLPGGSAEEGAGKEGARGQRTRAANEDGCVSRAIRAGEQGVKREQMLSKAQARTEPWDMVVIGGGATGMGVAVDAAARGLSVALIEAEDFGKGTSSRSTKLVHGGVRYLEQGNIPLVMSALKERGLMRQNAPHLVHDLAFVVPNYSWWEAPFYGIGLKLYDVLAGKYGFGASRVLSQEETLAQLPALEPEELRGGVVYYDGQFDDARLLIHLAMTAADHGAGLVNYCAATGLSRDADGYVN